MTKRELPGPTRVDIAVVLGVAVAAIGASVVLCYFVDKVLSTGILLVTGM